MNNHEHLLESFLSSIINTMDANEIFDITTQTLSELLDSDGLLFMYRQKTAHIYDVVRSLGDITYQKNYCVPCDTLMEELLFADSYVPIDDSSTHILNTMTSRQRRWLLEQDIVAFFTVKYNQAVVGFLFIANHKHRPLTPVQIDDLRTICRYASIALRNANLYQKAYLASITDDLTSLYNRKHALECIGECCYEQRPATLILLNIDDFKLYNELYGVREGDRLLHRCSQIIKQALSVRDKAFRFGADEFLLLIDGNNSSYAEDFATRIIKLIQSSQNSDMVWELTISCGIATFPDIATDAQAFLHNVEQAAYYSKLDGKGHISLYHHGMEKRTQNPNIRTAYERVAPTIYALTAAIDAKDNYTFIHSMNVSKYALILAEELGLDANEVEIVRDAGMLHDIGKISIPEHILKKSSNLTQEEYEIMKTHVENATKMIRYLPDMDYVIPAVLGHHERFDGTGYPRGLRGKEIPLMARILTIADCFDAMTGRRPYKQPYPVSYAIDEIQKNSGTQFDPELVSLFVSLVKEGKIAV